MSIVKLSADQFDGYVAENVLSVIEFSAGWCAPCQSFAKVLDSISEEFEDFSFATVDIDSEKALAEEFGIHSVPFVMILKNSTIIYAEAGAISRSALKDLLQQARDVSDALIDDDADRS